MYVYIFYMPISILTFTLISLRGESWVHYTCLIQTLFIEVPIPKQESVRSYRYTYMSGHTGMHTCPGIPVYTHVLVAVRGIHTCTSSCKRYACTSRCKRYTYMY